MARVVVLLAVLAGLLSGMAVLAQEATPRAAAEAQAGIPTAPVRFDERTLFTVRGTSSYPAGERAAAIAARITRVARNPAVDTGAIAVVPVDLGLEIRARDTQLMLIVPADATFESVRIETLAERHRARIQRAISEYRAERDPRQLLRGFLLSLLATVVLMALRFVVRRAYEKISVLMERRVHARIETLPTGTFQFVQGKQIWEAATATISGIRWLVLLIIFYLWMQFVLSQFPWTRALADQLLTLLVDPLRSIGAGFVDFVPNLLFLIVLAVLTRYGLRLLKLYFAALERGTTKLANFESEWALPAYKIIRTLVVALALVMAYPYLPGSGTEALRGISVFAGLMLSLGASGAVSNVISGYFNTFGRVFRVGDIIKVGEVVGEVTQVRLLTTRVRTIKNEEITVPNATIINTHLVNYSALAAQHGLILHTEVGIGYESPWRQVHAMLEEAARRTPGLLADPPPFILQRQLGDFAVVYQLNVYAGTARGMAFTYSRLHENILDVFNEHGVQIMTPAYESDPQHPKLVPPGQWYPAPAQSPESRGSTTPTASR